ncbi:MAG: hypothetical protein FJ293_05610 [Planctomycetes bacterium]|nr:hypothetical protein [Planctomycetota bacterium]
MTALAPRVRSAHGAWRAAGRVVAAALCATVSAAAAVRAQAPPSSAAAAQFLNSLDRDGNGFVGRDEWSWSGATFLVLDVDRDGWLTGPELTKTAKAPPAAATAADADRIAVAIGDLPDLIEPFRRSCLGCHDQTRVERVAKDVRGWADTVRAMRAKKEAKISEKDAKAVVDWLRDLRDRVALAVASFGTGDPAAAWGMVVGGGDLHQFDRDRNGRLDGGELGRLAHERADLDRNQLLSPGEFALLPLTVDRRALFGKLDRDKNGGVSLKELGTPTALLQLFDRNGDGQLDRVELPASRRFGGPFPLLMVGDAAVALELLDRDRDRRLSASELGRFGLALQRFDQDADASLDAIELETAVTAGRAEGPAAAFDDFFTRYDIDGNGSIGRREFPGRDAVFRRLDLDGDGELTGRDAPAGVARVDFTPEALRWRQ